MGDAEGRNGCGELSRILQTNGGGEGEEIDYETYIEGNDGDEESGAQCWFCREATFINTKSQFPMTNKIPMFK